MKNVFVVRLTDEERLELITLVRKGKASAIVIARARILLKANQGKKGEAKTDAQVAEALNLAAKTVFNIRRRCGEEGLEAAGNTASRGTSPRAHETFGLSPSWLTTISAQSTFTC